jgi:hypothetical protein
MIRQLTKSVHSMIPAVLILLALWTAVMPRAAHGWAAPSMLPDSLPELRTHDLPASWSAYMDHSLRIYPFVPSAVPSAMDVGDGGFPRGPTRHDGWSAEVGWVMCMNAYNAARLRQWPVDIGYMTSRSPVMPSPFGPCGPWPGSSAMRLGPRGLNAEILTGPLDPRSAWPVAPGERTVRR